MLLTAQDGSWFLDSAVAQDIMSFMMKSPVHIDIRIIMTDLGFQILLSHGTWKRQFGMIYPFIWPAWFFSSGTSDAKENYMHVSEHIRPIR